MHPSPENSSEKQGLIQLIAEPKMEQKEMLKKPSKVEAQLKKSNGKKPMIVKSPSDDEYETANESDSSGPLVEIPLSDDSINVEVDERRSQTEEEMAKEKAKGKNAQSDDGAEGRKGILGNFSSPAAIFSQFRKSFYGGSSSSDENETKNTEKHASSKSSPTTEILHEREEVKEEADKQKLLQSKMQIEDTKENWDNLFLEAKTKTKWNCPEKAADHGQR
ncbi:hypothetical protein niasHT_017452 [Heterodera trifolii]|uniref:Uncharacterized protein n=1 Tax=Heterodera trifolii TaxID=157864 RepID=A0ABD2LF67_9BILA